MRPSEDGVLVTKPECLTGQTFNGKCCAAISGHCLNFQYCPIESDGRCCSRTKTGVECVGTPVASTPDQGNARQIRQPNPVSPIFNAGKVGEKPKQAQPQQPQKTSGKLECATPGLPPPQGQGNWNEQVPAGYPARVQ
ncbi:uncharacterized protein N7503_001110 [Penicillium pulvis]|uniref:uncharacterized protein n=1 Tax=Penicillium pulvis TaxID=1562058 RepID=UPI0025478A40|nr:uncharacterized protein N7503_001110 [Penicillium pulvis]KAJ5814360.1 hypothetical protein N7503_001110 [Penicillium pulvis]